jgi:hypothetical protein
METERKYRYEQGWFFIIVGILFCGPAVPFLVVTAIENRTELLINGFIHLSEIPTSILFLLGASLFAFMFLSAIRSLFLKLRSKNYLVINSTEIIIPPKDSSFGARRIPVIVPFKEITNVEEIQLSKKQFMLYVTSTNVKATISSGKMKAKQEYEEVKTIISGRLHKEGSVKF